VALGQELAKADWQGWELFVQSGSENDTFLAEIIAEVGELMPLTASTPTDERVATRLGELRLRLDVPWEELVCLGFHRDCVAKAQGDCERKEQERAEAQRRAAEKAQAEDAEKRAAAGRSLQQLRAGAGGLRGPGDAAEMAREVWKLRPLLECGVGDLVQGFPDSVVGELRQLEADEQRERELRAQERERRAQGRVVAVAVEEEEEEEDDDDDDEDEEKEEEEKRKSELTAEEAAARKERQAKETKQKLLKKAEEAKDRAQRLGNLVLKIKKDGSLVLSAWDFGGQVVFSALHPIFMTPYGAYMEVFNMLRLLDPATQEGCLRNLDNWLRSLHMHAPCAPVFLIGTRADQVTVDDRMLVSDLLNERYHGKPFFIPREEGGTIVWPKQDEEHGQLVFFPVNNCESSADPFIQQLQSRIESTLAEESYVKERVPGSWLGVFDKLSALANPAMGSEDVPAMKQRQIVSRGEVRQIAIEGGIEEAEADVQVDAMLQLFHELGQFVYFPDSELRDLVILDPQWLIDAISRVIRIYDTVWNRKKYGDGAQAIIDSHRCADDRNAKLRHPQEWKQLTQHGILSDALAAKLWSAITETEGALVTNDMLHYLMAKFGLAVPLRDVGGDETAAAVNYLVPSLLPPAATAASDTAADWISCFILFEDLTGKYDTSPNSNDNIRKLSSFCDGFMPNGMFARLLAKLVDWSQNTGTRGGVNKYAEHHAQISFCGQVEMKCRLDVRFVGGTEGGIGAECIQVKLNKLNAGQMMDRIASLLRSIEAECMEHLQFHVAVDVTADVVRAGAEAGTTYVLGLDALKALDSGLPLHLECAGLCLRKADLASHHTQVWDVSPCEQHPDVFLSYRHATDSVFAQQLFDRLCFGKLPGEGEDEAGAADARSAFFSVGDEGRRMKVFFTQQKGALRTGEKFDCQLVDAIDSSLVFVPIVSACALDCMVVQPIDYLLLEWQVAMIIAESKGAGKAKLAVLPIVVPGARSVGKDEQEDVSQKESHADADAEALLNQMETHAPNEVPTETMARMLALLRRQYPEATLPPSAEGWRRTALQTINSLLHDVQRPEILHGSAFAATAAPREWNLVEAAAQSIFKLVADRVKEEPWHKEKNAEGVCNAVHEQSKALAISSGALSAEEERKIFSDAQHATTHGLFSIAARELCSYSQEYGCDEFKPPSKHPLLRPIQEAFALLRNRLGERAAEKQRLGDPAPPQLSEEEREIFRMCERFSKAFLIAYVQVCADGGNAELRKLMRTDSEAKKRQYFGTYQSQVKDNIGTQARYADAKKAAAALMPNAEMPGAPRDLSTFMGHAAAAQERVSALIYDFVEGHVGTLPHIGKLKGAYRVIEKALKSMRGPLEKLDAQWSYEKANDCARGGIECSDMNQCTECLEWFAGLQEAGTILLLKVKDRFSGPTDGGWSDFLVMFLFPDGAGQHIPCEIQIMHQKLVAARKGMKAHAAYDGFRAACETLALMDKLQVGAASSEGSAGGGSAAVAPAPPSTGIDTIKQRMADIKAIDDYDEDGALVAELKSLRKRAAAHKRIAEIKAIDDYDEDDELVTELKGQRKLLCVLAK
jgi:hypothetical protein